MLVRIVKMRFREDFVEQFLETFSIYRNEIRNSQGCMNLELLRDMNQPSVFMTYSWWNSQEDLEAYRHSETFKEVWPLTKKGFTAKPEAWSLIQEDVVDGK